MLNATLECHMAGPHALSFEVFEKKSEKKLPSTLFLESKVQYKRKQIKINHPTVHNLSTNNYLKYL